MTRQQGRALKRAADKHVRYMANCKRLRARPVIATPARPPVPAGYWFALNEWHGRRTGELARALRRVGRDAYVTKRWPQFVMDCDGSNHQRRVRAFLRAQFDNEATQ